MASSTDLGIEALKSGNPVRAASLFEFALKNSPGDAALRLLAAQAWREAAEPAQAILHLRWILDHSAQLERRGEVMLLAGAREALHLAERELASRGIATAEPTSPEAPAVDGPPVAETGTSTRKASGKGPTSSPTKPPAKVPDRSSGKAFDKLTGKVSGKGAGRAQGKAPARTSKPWGPPRKKQDGPERTVRGEPVVSTKITSRLEKIALDRPRVLACPWCGNTVFLEADGAGRCTCPWSQPAFDSRLYLVDLQRLCVEGKARITFRMHHDLYILDGREVRLKLLSDQAHAVDAGLVFDRDLGHSIILPERLAPVMPQVHSTATFRLLPAGDPGQKGTGALGPGDLLEFEDMVAFTLGHLPGALGALPRDVYLDRQVARDLPDDLRERVAALYREGGRSYGQCLAAAGLSWRQLLDRVPGWQDLPRFKGHGRLEALRRLVGLQQVKVEDARRAVLAARGRDPLEELIREGCITQEDADRAREGLDPRTVALALRDDVAERLCRRGVIPRTTLLRAGRVAGMDGERQGSEVASAASRMTEIPKSELKTEARCLEIKLEVLREERVPLGLVLVELGFCSRHALAQALVRQLTDDAPLAELLFAGGHITPEQGIIAVCAQSDRIEALASAPAPKARHRKGGQRPGADDSESEEDSTSGDEGQGVVRIRELRVGRFIEPAAIRRVATLWSTLGALLLLAAVTVSLWSGQVPWKKFVFKREETGAKVTASSQTGKPVAEAPPTPTPVPPPTYILDVPLRGVAGGLLEEPQARSVRDLRRALERARKENPRDPLRVAVLLRALGETDGCRHEIVAALQKAPDNPALLANAAVLALEDNDLRSARLAARRAVYVAPKDAFARIALGAVRAAERDEPGATKEFGLARSLDPSLEIVVTAGRRSLELQVVRKEPAARRRR